MTMSLGERFEAFLRPVVPSSSGAFVDSLTPDDEDTTIISNYLEPLIQWHSVASQNTWIFTKTAVRTSNLRVFTFNTQERRILF
jgi:hypothetical protein